MVESHRRSLRAPLFAAATLVAAAVLLASGICFYVAMFSSFAAYDDEGYVMMSLQSFLDGRPLYRETFTQYGPFYYLAAQIVYGLSGAAVSHDVTRLVTLATGIAAAALLAWAAYAMTASFAVALITYLQGVLHLFALANEPGHPQGLLLLLLAAIVATAARLPGRRWMVILLGALTAASLLVKVNVGVYIALPVVLALLGASSPTPRIQGLRLLTSVLLALLPLVVTRAHLGSWGTNYALVVSAALAASSVSIAKQSADPLRPATAGLYGGATAVGAALVLVVTVLLGTPVYAVIEGVLLNPLRFAGVFEVPWVLPRIHVIIALVAVALAAAMAIMPATSTVGLRLALKAAFAIAVCLAVATDTTAMFLVAPFVWVVALSSSAEPEDPRRTLPRALLALLASGQLLVAYPVAGSQQLWATWLLIPAAAVSAWDAFERRGGYLRAPSRTVVDIVAVVVLLMFYQPQFPVRSMWRSYAAQPALDLPGARRMHLPPETAAPYQAVVAWIRRDCGTLITMPGLNSLYFWSQKRPPTGQNATAWMTLLSESTQRQVIARIASDRTACVVRDEQLAAFWNQGRDVSALPLVKYINDSFRTVAHEHTFDLMVRNDRDTRRVPDQPFVGSSSGR